MTYGTVANGLSLLFEQRWQLRELRLGDLSSTMSLAPGEQLTLEFQSSQRKRLEQSTVDSTEQLDSTESTRIDKEVVNVAASASRTDNWKVDGSGSFSLGFFSIGASGGASSSVTKASSSSMQHISEATRKAAHSLKTPHKIEVRGVTEGFTQTRQTRVIRNPYRDRALSLNVFQLLKHFNVTTELAEVRPAVLISIEHLAVDERFVELNIDFLQRHIFDRSILDDLPTALAALRLLFQEANLYGFRPVRGDPDTADPKSSLWLPDATEYIRGYPAAAIAQDPMRVALDNRAGALYIALAAHCLSSTCRCNTGLLDRA